MPFDLQCRLKLGGAVGDDLPLIATNGFLDKVLSFLSVTPVVADSPLGAYTVKTYLNPLVFTPDTVLADLTESGYPGYADQAGAAFSPAGSDDSGNQVIVADLPVPFQVTGDPAGEQFAGVYLLDADGDLAMGLGLTLPIALTVGLLIPMTFVIQLGNLP